MDRKIKSLTRSALAAAAVFFLTWAVRIPAPGAAAGYLNAGDIGIYLLSLTLPGSAAALSAAVGSAMADLAGGFPLFIPATFVIKGLMGLICGRFAKRRSFPMYAAGCLLAGLVMAAGYALYETAVFGAGGALAEIIPNLLQSGVSAGVSIALFPAAVRLAREAGRQ